MKKVLIIFLLGIVSLQASLRELDQSEISLQGSLSFSEIIVEAEKQLGVKVRLPLKADNQAKMDYNQVITLRNLAQAVVVHFAQDDIPLTWKYEAKVLWFQRKDLRSQVPKRSDRGPKKSSPVTRTTSNRYPVPTIKTPPDEPDYPSMPRWAQEKTVSKKLNETTMSINDLPSLTQSGVSAPNWNTGSSRPSIAGSQSSTSMTKSLPTISRDPGAFSVKIPKKPAPVIRPKPSLDTFDSPSGPGPMDLNSIGGSSRVSPSSPSSLGSSGTGRDRVSSWSSMNQPSSIGKSPSFRPTSATPSEPRRGNFTITPYPEGAVAFINDAPSIVPGAAKEGFIEWATRLRGALREGNMMVLEAEKEELERRLRWLKENLR